MIIMIMSMIIVRTRNMGQSPTWGRPGGAQASLDQFLARVKTWGPANPTGRNIVWRKIQFGCVNVSAYNFFCLWTKVHQRFFAHRGRGCSWSLTFPIFDIWIRSGDIRDQIQYLSEIAPNFRRFLPSQILGGRPSPKVVSTWTPLPRSTSCGKVSRRYSH